MQFASGMLAGETFERDYGSRQEMVNLSDTKGTRKGGINDFVLLASFLICTYHFPCMWLPIS